MKRSVALVTVLMALAAASCRADQDAIVLRGDITKSANLPRTFSVRVVGTDGAYVMDGKLEDDLRYSMLLRSAQGRPLVDYIVRDDTLAIRLRDRAFGSSLANVLGDPVIDSALKAGKWVQDPSGAPSVVAQTLAAGVESSGNPFQDARQILLFAQSAIGQAVAVSKFSLEDITYKSRYDPWRYPHDKSGELRYDLRPPPLPHSEAQTLRGSGDIGNTHFRKLSVFVQSGRVEQMCEMIDVFGHEDYVALKQHGPKWNPFLQALFDRVVKGDTAVPIRPRYMVADVSYPSDVSVAVPAGAAPGKLTVFLSAVQQAITSGVLKPASNADTSDCRRTPTTNDTGTG